MASQAFPFSPTCNRRRSLSRALSKLFIFARNRVNQSGACFLFFPKTNEKDACFRVPQTSPPPQSCAKEKSSGVEIERHAEETGCAVYICTYTEIEDWSSFFLSDNVKVTWRSIRRNRLYFHPKHF